MSLVSRLAKGIRLLHETVGEGPAAEKGAVVTYNLRVFLSRGEELTRDSQIILRARKHVNVRVVDQLELIDHVTELGKRQPIAGIEKSLYGMKKGGYREVLVSPHLAYGENGVEGFVPPNAVLRLRIWVRDVKPLAVRRQEREETMKEENVRILKEGYALWNQNKEQAFELWMDLIDENVQWRSLADGASGMEFTRSCCNKNEVVRYFQELADNWEMIHYHANEFIAEDDRVVMIGECAWKHRGTGKRVDTPKVDIFRMRDGKIVEFFELYDTAKAVEGSQS